MIEKEYIREFMDNLSTLYRNLGNAKRHEMSKVLKIFTCLKREEY